MNETTMFFVVILAAVVLILLFLRGKKTRVQPTLTPRRMREKAAEEEAVAAPKEPQWKLRDLAPGGKFHLSLPKGLEEDYLVTRRDRLVWPDEQIEYNLRLAVDDPNSRVWLHWWTIGVATHAWLLEGDEYTLERLGLTPEALEAMRQSGEGTITFKDQTFTLERVQHLTVFEGGLRPGRDFVRWDFRNEAGTRQVLIQRKEWEGPDYQVLLGREVWLRDLTVITPRGEAPGQKLEQDQPPTGPPAEQ